MMSNMVLGLRLGQMAVVMKASISMEPSTAKESSPGQMGQLTKAHSNPTISAATATTSGPTGAPIKASGRTTR